MDLYEDSLLIRETGNFSVKVSHHRSSINDCFADARRKSSVSGHEDEKVEISKLPESFQPLPLTTKEGIWFPVHKAELDFCQQIHVLQESDQGKICNVFEDEAYLKRKKYISNIAKQYKHGQPIPYVDYTAAEAETWKIVYSSLEKRHESWACSEYLRSFSLLKRECGYSPDKIPQLQDVSDFLTKCSGFRLRPTAGLLSSRDFLASLAFKVFQCTQYIRHSSTPLHTPEPDCCHELIGHVPMLCDPTFATFSQEIGLASLGANDDDIQKLATLYWFTVEFGLCKEKGNLKVYGAGLLSAFGELDHAVSDVPTHLPFEAEIASVQPYQDLHYQDVYFVSNSFEEAIKEIREFSTTKMKRSFDVRYSESEEKVVILPKSQ